MKGLWLQWLLPLLQVEVAVAVVWYGAECVPLLWLSLVLRKCKWLLMEMYLWELKMHEQIHRRGCDYTEVSMAQD